jgi:histidinol phosphatase-like enzyme
MAKQIEAQLGAIDYASSWMVGDKEKDVQFGDNIGVSTALIKSRHWDLGAPSTEPDLIVSSLEDFAEQIGRG